MRHRTLADLPIELVGVDPSPGMLNKARARRNRASLVCAPAEALPFSPNSVYLIFCVNALHHFSHPEKFLQESRRLLRTGGRVAIFGLDPHARGTEWYLYEYFAGVREKDLARYMPHAQLRRLMIEAGFQNVSTDLAEHIQKTFVGEAVLNDPFLERTSTSQFLVIPEESYHTGRRAIVSAIEDANQRGSRVEFVVDLKLFATVGETGHCP